MAFIDTDEDGNEFANVTFSVGPGKANFSDDVLLVQLLLTYHYGMGGTRVKGPKGYIPQNPPVDLNTISLGAFDAATGTLIKDYQMRALKRPKPEGYIEMARGKNKSSFTICEMNTRLWVLLLNVKDPRSVIDYLRAFPALAASLQKGVIAAHTTEIK